MIIVSHQHKYAYYLIPKVASMSIRKLLAAWEGLKWRHPWQGDCGFETADAPPEGYFTFTFIRHPLDRLVSCYMDKVVGVRKLADCDMVRDGVYLPFAKRYPGLDFANMSFAEFAMLVCLTPDEQSDAHFASQASMLPANPSKALSFVGLFEWLEHDVLNLRRMLRIPPGIPFTHEHPTVREKWERYYTPELKRAVEKRYQRDMQL